MPEIDLLPGGPRKLGLGYQDIGEQLARYFQLKDDHGVLVTHVEDDGPAGRAGVKAGDVILSFDGRKVRDGDDLRQAVRRAEPGQEVTLSLWRNGGGLDAKVKLAGPSERRGGISL
jgi:S1-C subfamily serine protease